MIIIRRKADYLILYTSERAALVGINNVLVSLPTLEPHVAHSYFSYFVMPTPTPTSASMLQWLPGNIHE